MPKLNAVVEKLDDVDEGLRELYVEQKDKDDKVVFVLDLSDSVKSHPKVVALHNAHERQKEENKTLKTENAELKKKADTIPEDFDPEEFERMKEVDKELQELKEQGGGDDKSKQAHEAEIASFKKQHEQKVDRLNKQMEDGFKERDEKIVELTGRIHKMIVQDGLTRLLAENGVKKDVLPFVQAKLERMAKVVDNDNGDPVLVFNTDLGEVPGTQYIPDWVNSDEAKPFIELQSGGGAPGNLKKGGSFSDTNPWSKENWNMANQAAILTKDRGKADRMARAAGHKQAAGALLLDAK